MIPLLILMFVVLVYFINKSNHYEECFKISQEERNTWYNNFQTQSKDLQRLSEENQKLKSDGHVQLMWHTGNFARKVASSFGRITNIIVNNEDSFNRILGVFKETKEMTEWDMTPKLPENHPWKDELE